MCTRGIIRAQPSMWWSRSSRNSAHPPSGRSNGRACSALSPGAGGIVAANMVAKVPPDGHVLMLGDSGAMAINPTLNPTLGYDPIRDFAPITALVSLPIILVANPTVPAATLPQFIALAKQQPGKMSFGSAGAHDAARHDHAGERHRQLHAVHQARVGALA